MPKSPMPKAKSPAARPPRRSPGRPRGTPEAASPRENLLDAAANIFAERGLAAMCTDAWRWSQSHPGGFARAGSKAAAV